MLEKTDIFQQLTERLQPIAGINIKYYCYRYKHYTTVIAWNLQRYHRGNWSDHSVLQDSQLTPEQQHPDRERNNLTSIHSSHTVTSLSVTSLLLLSHGPRWAAAQRGQMWLLLLDLQHEHQAGVLVTQEVQQENQEVVDDVGLVALPARVHVDGQVGISQSQPLKDVQQAEIIKVTWGKEFKEFH